MLITDIKGIGSKTGALFHKIGIENAEDLLTYYPRGYDSYKKPVLVNDIREPGIYTVYGLVAVGVDVVRKGSLQVVSTVIKDENGTGLSVTWFNMPFLRASVKRGSRYLFRGRVLHKHGRLVMEQPIIYSPADYQKLLNTMQPLYGLTAGLTNNMVVKAVRSVFFLLPDIPEYLPQDIVDSNNFMSINSAIHTIHFPENQDEFEQARKRIVFDEFFFFILALKKMKSQNEDFCSSFFIEANKRTDAMLAKLPYSLTSAQSRVLGQIRDNLASGRMMNRLVQGDVGSGKTIIALAALMDTVYAGYQGAMMAPTEVLARQHYESITTLFEEQHIDIRVGLLVGSMTPAAKKKCQQQIADGDIDIIIGTNAIIQKNVIYRKLALVITDEQHRFGVNQRKELSLKGERPHILVMSATPIPRTLAIILYGDLDVSVLDELPASRLPIKNCVVDETYRPKAYSFIQKETAAGHQAYVICPLVEESENTEAENVIEYSENLRQAMPQVNIAFLHGRMKAAEKNQIMEEFSSGRIQVLVSTTVVEVGVNVPNATVMMIENAQQFGLAQLHQLRGRVGRGRAQSYCIFINSNVNEKTKKRLDIMNHSNDGFYIANEDLRLRGPGDFFGIRQSGDFRFALGDIYNDAQMLTAASECVDRFLKGDFYMNKSEEQRLMQKLSKYTEKCLNQLNI